MATVTPYQPTTAPIVDGAINIYIAAEAVASGYFDWKRRVLFINGINNTGQNHMDAALSLSLLQMCTVVGVYNKSDGVVQDLVQCLGDKWQFSNGPLARLQTAVIGHDERDVRAALARDATQPPMFDFLRKPENRKMEIFAHSQGNLIASNVLMAIKIVDGAQAVKGWKVNTFGSPSVNWPSGINIQEYGFTFDMVNILSGPNITRSISKVGWPSGTNWPVTHGFNWYMKEDPNFTINRFRTGGWGMTLNLDATGLAKCLIAMGVNLPRVAAIFAFLETYRNAESDNVAEAYVDRVRSSHPEIASALARDAALKDRLIHILGTGIVFPGERKDVEYLKALV